MIPAHFAQSLGCDRLKVFGKRALRPVGREAIDVAMLSLNLLTALLAEGE